MRTLYVLFVVLGLGSAPAPSVAGDSLLLRGTF